MRLRLLLVCYLCGATARVQVDGEVCPDCESVHVAPDDPALPGWYGSHLQPDLRLLGVVS